MSTNVRSTAVGVFRDQRLADQAVAHLENAGFTHDQIHYSGAGSAGSFFKSLFTGQAATSGSLSNDLASMGLSDEEVQYYANEYRNGNPVIAVQAPGREQEARNILQRDGAYDYSMTHGPVNTMAAPQQPSANMPGGTRDANRPVNTMAAPQQPPANMPGGTRDANRNMPPPNTQSQPPQMSSTPPPTAGQRFTREEQRVTDETTRPMSNPPSTPTSPQVNAPPVAQQTTATNDPQAQMQALQAHYQQIQQQLQDAQAQLQAAKQREAHMQASRQQEMQMHAMQKQLQDAQMQLQSTLAELQATEARISAQYNQSQQ